MLPNQPYHHHHHHRAVETPFYPERLEIITHSCYTSKLRYRSDYEMNKTRRGVLHSRNNTIYQSPIIRVNLLFSDRLSFCFSSTKKKK